MIYLLLLMTMLTGTLIAIIYSIALTSTTRVARVAAVEIPPSASNLSDLPFDENDHLSTHVLAVPAGKCGSLLKPKVDFRDGSHGHKWMTLGGEAFESVFGHLGAYADFSDEKVTDFNKDCLAVCLEKGTLREVVARPLPHRYFVKGKVDQDGDGERVEERNVQQFFLSDSCAKVEYGFVNYHDNPIVMYWINHRGIKVFNQKIGVGERKTTFIDTFISHKFEFYDSQPNEDPLQNELLMSWTIPNHGIIGFKNYEFPKVPVESVERQVHQTLKSEWRRHEVVKRTFSPLAFDKGRLPDDLYASLGAYWYNNRDVPHVVHEEWGRHKGVFVNYWETDVNFIQIPWHLKKRWQRRLREMVEAWTGVELETTDMYGMREYTKGARLLSHVDRESTHAASLIVNIAQQNVSKPWTIEVHDHADRLHEVVMEPGDIVYYESAKALHGRNTPLQSGTYVNLFTHYRPLNDPDWYLRDNPEGTPEPLLDVGECNLVGKPDDYSKGAVQCENSAIGPHLSPSMFTATSADDMFQWWKSVGPADETVEEENDNDEL
ncbi:hypothetical protein ACHAWT_004204 [Skeletonema menzelii]|mmetsp:Transcript_9979/g.16496  ORF Transcript_9979/g.16496 Transcript_9979/m.16496 type:complete len:548 (+) Transcript_9979:56-1699(+)